jgi:hypothetical protein
VLLALPAQPVAAGLNWAQILFQMTSTVAVLPRVTEVVSTSTRVESFIKIGRPSAASDLKLIRSRKLASMRCRLQTKRPVVVVEQPLQGVSPSEEVQSAPVPETPPTPPYICGLVPLVMLYLEAPATAVTVTVAWAEVSCSCKNDITMAASIDVIFPSLLSEHAGGQSVKMT